MPENTKVTYWIKLSEYDLLTASAMLKSRRYLYVGFMCHQVIEKILKAYFASVKNKIPPYSHNLRYLGEESLIYNLFSEEQKLFLNELEPLNIESRYPHYKDKVFRTLNSSRCKDLINKTKRLHKWIKLQLSAK